MSALFRIAPTKKQIRHGAMSLLNLPDEVRAWLLWAGAERICVPLDDHESHNVAVLLFSDSVADKRGELHCVLAFLPLLVYGWIIVDEDYQPQSVLISCSTNGRHQQRLVPWRGSREGFASEDVEYVEDCDFDDTSHMCVPNILMNLSSPDLQMSNLVRNVIAAIHNIALVR